MTGNRLEVGDERLDSVSILWVVLSLATWEGDEIGEGETPLEALKAAGLME